MSIFSKITLVIYFGICSLSSTYAVLRPVSELPFKPKKIKEVLNKNFYFENDNWIKKVEIENESYKVEYSFDSRLEKSIKREILRYRPDYVSVVALDNNDGRILAAVDYDRSLKEFGRNLSFSSSHPAASLFKVVTAAALLEGDKVEPESMFKFKGRSTTLYRYQLKNPRNRRWVRNQNFRYAFALSNNVIFGRAAIDYLNGKSIVNMAESFGFNRDLLRNISLSRSFVSPPISLYNMAELASGFNRKTLISPIHGAYIASIIARGGTKPSPYVVKGLSPVGSMDSYQVVSKGQTKGARVLSPETSRQLGEMMELTVKRGTARSAFRRFFRRGLGKKYFVGGKTGTITGGIPYGKRDWFVSFLRPKQDKSDKGISLCVMIINKKKWYVRSSELTKRIMFRYIKQKVKKKSSAR